MTEEQNKNMENQNKNPDSNHQPAQNGSGESRQKGQQNKGSRNHQNKQHNGNQRNGQKYQSKSGQRRNGNRNGQQSSNRNRQQNGNRRQQNGSQNRSEPSTPWGMNPRQTEAGIQTRSQRGEIFAKNWWARHWIDALENLMQGVRLERGQHYARMGQIVSMEEIKGGIMARVQGSRPKPYRVTIQLTPLNNRQWEKVFDILADKAIYVAKLLAGEMPEDIESVFTEAGVSLFPTRSIDLQTKCTCPDKVTPCKHIAATHYILGDRFDEDPFLLFRMRGRNEEQIMEALRQRRGAESVLDSSLTTNGASSASSEPDKPRFPQTLDHFWSLGKEIDEVNVKVKMPNIPQPLLKRLGEPEFSTQLTLQGQLEESYNSISTFAMLIAYADTANGGVSPEDDE